MKFNTETWIPTTTLGIVVPKEIASVFVLLDALWKTLLETRLARNTPFPIRSCLLYLGLAFSDQNIIPRNTEDTKMTVFSSQFLLFRGTENIWNFVEPCCGRKKRSEYFFRVTGMETKYRFESFRGTKSTRNYSSLREYMFWMKRLLLFSVLRIQDLEGSGYFLPLRIQMEWKKSTKRATFHSYNSYFRFVYLSISTQCLAGRDLSVWATEVVATDYAAPLLSCTAAYWATLQPTMHFTKLPKPRPTKLPCPQLSYAAPNRAALHQTQLRRTLLSFAASYVVALHPTELRCTILIYAAPYWAIYAATSWATSCRFLSYSATSELLSNLWAPLHPYWATLNLAGLKCVLEFFLRKDEAKNQAHVENRFGKKTHMFVSENTLWVFLQNNNTKFIKYTGI
jgi:hypothetical protein